MKNNHKTTAITLVSFISNIFLAIIKITTGIIFLSRALISDGINSLGDLIGLVVAFIGLKISKKAPDDNHPFGHDRYDSIASIVLVMIFLFSGLLIAKSAIESLINHDSATPLPSISSLYVMLVVIVIKESLFIYTYITSKKIKSDALKAIAYDHQMDVISSVVALLGVFLARYFSLAIIDSIASLLIALIIVITSIKIFINAINNLVDSSAKQEVIDQLIKTILNVPGVIRIDMIKTRMFAQFIYVDVEIACDNHLSLIEAHDIAESVHDLVEQTFNQVKHIMVHVNPQSMQIK